MATTLTPIQAVLNTALDSTATLCTVDTSGDPEVFEITFTAPAGKCYIEINNTAAVGTITYSLAAGTGYANSSAALTGSVLQTKSCLLHVEDARYKTGGKMTLTVTPTAATKLKTGNIVTVKAVQLV
ncbi:hypothetical protein [Dehalobacter restrictus]|uniref:Uncharacterized protein n=1 Tax=Dehalobacter restrictus TaxID=55583 RepID=A0A857DFW1_9FIRM|nr:hypothetical protein [Dehalobacter restrictus]QGZ99428.1 hypothetical protein GQ588_01480 [Dehalobacter restrictus]